MTALNEMAYRALYQLLDFLVVFGLPLSILAWLSAFFVSTGMVVVLRRRSLQERWKSSAAVGCLALTAQLLDYYVTLAASPDLALEANPLWRIVADKMGLKIALWMVPSIVASQ